MAESTDNQTTVALADIPPIKSFQFQSDPVGQIKKSVNLFRGSVTLPLQLASLKADHGLSVAVSATYDGSDGHKVTIWNQDAPTGIMGLGWTLPVDQIVAVRSGTSGPDDTDYYLQSSGTASLLVQTGMDSDGSLLFQGQSFQFWRIRYYRNDERWEVTNEDGTTSIYGGSSVPGQSDGNSVQWAVANGNWMMASAETMDQRQIAAAWNLRQMTSVQGHSVTYTYSAVSQAVGQGGKTYTKACYLSEITDSAGRSILFRYADKLYQPGHICEYQDPHKVTPDTTPNGYQTRYETLYLAEIQVIAPDRTVLNSVKLSYDFFNSAANSDPNYPNLFKRTLIAAHIRDANGDPMPGMTFSYNAPGTTAQGMLADLCYPQGAEASYAYDTLPLPSSRDMRINNPFTSNSTVGTPGVWHGPDYTVVTWVDTVGKQLKVSAYSWAGHWVDWTPGNFVSADVDLSTLTVAASQNFFAIFFRDTAAGQGRLLLYRRDQTLFGTWTSQTMSAPMGSGTAHVTTYAGQDFIVVASPAFTSTKFMGAWWNWRQGQWTNPMLPTIKVTNPANVAITGAGNAYLACSYDSGGQTGYFQLIGLKPDGSWTNQSWTMSMKVYAGASDFAFTWSPLSSGAVATYLETMDSAQATGKSMAFQWDENLIPISPTNPQTTNLTTAVVNGAMVNNILATGSADAMMGNGGQVSRYVGGAANNWAALHFPAPPSPDDAQTLALGAQGAAVITNANGTMSAQFASFNPNIASAGGWSQPITVSQADGATVGDGVSTVGTAIYAAQPTGTWIKTGTLLADQGRSVDATSVQNFAPNYLAYQDTAGAMALTYVALIENGIVQQRISLGPTPQKIAAAGCALAGPNAFVTYPAGGDFSAAPYLTLYKVVAQGVTGTLNDTPVTSLQVSTGFGDALNPDFQQSIRYQNAGMVLDSASGVAQYSKVSVATGTISSSGPTPQGRTEFYFSNGLSSTASRFYTVGWPINYANILNGSMLASQSYDADNVLLAEDINWYQIYRSTPQFSALFGAYARTVKTTKTRDGVQKVVDTAFDSNSGLPLSQISSSYLGGSTLREYRMTNTYAIQVQQYKSAMQQAWLLSPVAQRLIEVDGVAVQSNATTYKNWPTVNSGYWARESSYAWAGTGSADFDFSNPAGNSDWMLKGSVLARQPSGRVAAKADSMGVITSYLFDSSDHFQIAGFTNADVTQKQAGYIGFEPYDPGNNWSIEGTASVQSGDAHSGTSALKVAAQTSGLKGDFVAATGDMYLTCWIKTPASFASDGGQAFWQVDVGGNSQTIDVQDTGGEWAALTARIPVAAGLSNQPVSLTLTNNKATADLLLDDVRISPFVGAFSARVLDINRRIVRARLNGAVATTKFLYDASGKNSATFGPGNASQSVASIATAALSRSTGSSDSFAPAQPNTSVSATMTQPGIYLDLASGTALDSQYVATPAGAWTTAGTALVFAGGQAGQLVAADNGMVAPLAFRFHLAESAMLSGPVSAGLMANGTPTASVAFDPASGNFSFSLDGKPVQTARKDILDLPASAGPEFDQGDISDDTLEAFALTGWPLASGSTVHVTTTGQSWVLQDSTAGKNYYAAVNGTQISVTILPRQWTLVIGTGSAQVLVDGTQIFGIATSGTLSGVPYIALDSAMAVSSLLIGREPMTSVQYSDGQGRPVQRQSLHDGASIVQHTLYDTTGNVVAQTSAATVQPQSQPVLAYAAGFVTAVDPATGMMSGLVADANPEAEGYPYGGSRYENSPLARKLESGQPGKVLAINPSVDISQRKTSQYAYGGNAARSGLPANEYWTTTLLSPAKKASTSFTDKATGYQVGKVMNEGPDQLQTFYDFSPAGNIETIKSPNYFAPPAGTSPTDWELTMTFDASRNMLSQNSPNMGQTQYVYDPQGRLRFTSDAEGAAKGYIAYTKYDPLGRVVETGTYAATFDRASLQDKADNDPSWPESPTWYKRLTWDGDGSDPLLVGQMASCETANATPGTADVIESFQYDISGRIVAKASTVDGLNFSFGYGYDIYGNTKTIDYPASAGVGSVCYSHDDLGRIVAIGTSQDALAYSAYQYTDKGSVDFETFQPAGQLPLIRKIGHNSPGWIDSITAGADGSAPVFTETLDYFSGGYPSGEGQYDGSISSLSFDYGAAGGGSYEYQLEYDSHAQLQAAKDNVSSAYDFGIATPVSYDANGNILTSSVGEDSMSYGYAPGSGDKLQTVSAAQDTLARHYQYDASGNVTSVSGGMNLAFGYEPTTGLPATVTDPASGAVIAFAYDGKGRRVGISRASGGKICGMGQNRQALVEWVGASRTPQVYIYGPAGLAVLITGGTTAYVIRDHERSPRALCATDGSLLACFDYLPFGSVARQTGAVGLTDRRFTGQDYDPETGLYLFQSRLYDPTVGRFLAPDPKHQFFSPYIYAANNPLSFVDPTGQFAIFAALIEGMVDLLALAFTAGETTEVAAATTGAVATTAETGEAVATGATTVAAGTSTAVETGGASTVATATTSEAMTTSLADVATVSTESAESSTASISSLDTSSDIGDVATRSRGFIWNTFYPTDVGGSTAMNPTPFTSWPLTYLNGTGLTAYNPVVTVFDAPGTTGFVDTAAHEGFHALVATYLPMITQAGDATVGGIEIGSPVLWSEETVAYSVGHIAAGRIWAVPFAPFEAFGSMTTSQGLTAGTIFTGGALVASGPGAAVGIAALSLIGIFFA